MNKYADEFYATFQELARKYSAEKVWQDVIYACALTQSVFLRSQDKSGLEKIDKIMEQYSEKEQYNEFICEHHGCTARKSGAGFFRRDVSQA